MNSAPVFVGEVLGEGGVVYSSDNSLLVFVVALLVVLLLFFVVGYFFRWLFEKKEKRGLAFVAVRKKDVIKCEDGCCGGDCGCRD